MFLIRSVTKISYHIYIYNHFCLRIVRMLAACAEPLLLTHCAHAHCLQFEPSGNGLMSHIRETSKVTINNSYFHPAHQHYTTEYTEAELAAILLFFVSPCHTSFPRATQIALASVIRRVFSQKHRKNTVRK